MAFKDKLRGQKKREFSINGDTVEVRSLPLGERRLLLEAVKKDAEGEPDNEDFQNKLLAACVFENGAKVFTEEDAAFIQSEADGEAITELLQIALEINGFKAPEKNALPTPS